MTQRAAYGLRRERSERGERSLAPSNLQFGPREEHTATPQRCGFCERRTKGTGIAIQVQVAHVEVQETKRRIGIRRERGGTEGCVSGQASWNARYRERSPGKMNAKGQKGRDGERRTSHDGNQYKKCEIAYQGRTAGGGWGRWEKYCSIVVGGMRATMKAGRVSCRRATTSRTTQRRRRAHHTQPRRAHERTRGGHRPHRP